MLINYQEKLIRTIFLKQFILYAAAGIAFGIFSIRHPVSPQQKAFKICLIFSQKQIVELILNNFKENILYAA